MKDIIVVIGAGAIGIAIARRIGSGKHILLADVRQENVEKVGEQLYNAGFAYSTTTVDVTSRTSVEALAEKANAMGRITTLIHAAGVSPSQATPEVILKVDLYGTALVLEVFGNYIAEGGAGVVISSQSGHRLEALTEEENRALALTPTEELLNLPITQNITESLRAYQVSKRANGLRVMAEAVRWGEKKARINAISPGIVITPLANDELNGPRGEGYRRMLSQSPIGRAATADEVGEVGELLLTHRGAFITGSDFLMDGGVTAAYWFGNIQNPTIK